MAAVGPADGFWYQVKGRVLGSPLVTGQLAGQRLSRPLALGVLSCAGWSPWSLRSASPACCPRRTSRP